MRQLVSGTVALGAVLLLSACDDKGVKSPAGFDKVGVVDASDLNDIMLTVADPNEAVDYFQAASQKDPSRIEFQRGLAQSLVRAKRAAEATVVYSRIVETNEVTNEDHINYADALIRTNNWKDAEKQLNMVPPTVETFKRYRLEAMVADSKKDWKKSDSFYKTAVSLTTKPASVLNNWGYSKLARGDHSAAERLFIEAITYDKKLFTAKNNLVLARGAQRNYSLPVIQMTQVEKAELLYTLALSAIKQGDVDIGRGLLEEAIDTHPRHFPAAVRSLQALENNVAG